MIFFRLTPAHLQNGHCRRYRYPPPFLILLRSLTTIFYPTLERYCTPDAPDLLFHRFVDRPISTSTCTPQPPSSRSPQNTNVRLLSLPTVFPLLLLSSAGHLLRPWEHREDLFSPNAPDLPHFMASALHRTRLTSSVTSAPLPLPSPVHHHHRTGLTCDSRPVRSITITAPGSPATLAALHLLQRRF